MESWLDEYSWVLALLPFGMAGLVIFSIPPFQAKRRGYSFFVWLITGILLYNPIYLLVVLSVSPHRKRQQMRVQFCCEIDAKLAANAPAVVAAGSIPERSLGDQPTVPPWSAAATADPARSLGDASTVMPPAQSLGDKMTRL